VEDAETPTLDKDTTNLEIPTVGEKKQLPAKRKKEMPLEQILKTVSNKKKKLSTLEKSREDWSKFKNEEGEEAVHELEQHKKTGGYLGQQAFLQRADIKQFEQERAVRTRKKKQYF